MVPLFGFGPTQRPCRRLPCCPGGSLVARRRAFMRALCIVHNYPFKIEVYPNSCHISHRGPQLERMRAALSGMGIFVFLLCAICTLLVIVIDTI